MNSKWYFRSLIVVLAILGISMGPSSVPNQEIVVQFNDKEVASDEARDAIATVKRQLQTIGVENIQIIEGEDGRLKITYYSDVAVAVIKSIFSEEKELELVYASNDLEKEPTDFPFSNSSKTYKLNVCEIQSSSNADLDFNGYFPELKAGTDPYYNPVVYLSISEEFIKQRNRTEKVTYTVHRNGALLIDDAAYSIPEVRAGPSA